MHSSTSAPGAGCLMEETGVCGGDGGGGEVVVEVMVVVVVVVVSEFSSKRTGLKRERRWRKEAVVKGVLAERMSHILPVPSCPR